MRTGIYRTCDGELVHVTKTEGGTYVIRYGDGTTAVLK